MPFEVACSCTKNCCTAIRKTAIALAALFSAGSSIAQIYEYQLEQLIGWTIVASKTIEGYRDPGSTKVQDWEGCDFDRVVYFLDGTSVKCGSFGYQYAYMPQAILFARQVTYNGKEYTMLKMLVEGELFDVN